MSFIIISAIGENNEIGKNGKLLWHLRDDLKNFKKLTNNKIVIMGRKTYESLPIKPLPNRLNIVITSDDDKSFDYKVVTAIDINDAINKSYYWSDIYDDNIFIIGGEQIYNQFINKCDKMYITKVHKSFDADTFFPKINEKDWEIKSIQKYEKNEHNDYDFEIIEYERKLI
jgi:dihydrofolate reductase